MPFRIMPRVWQNEPVQRTFENVKVMVNASALTMRFEIPIAGAMSGFEQASIRRIPYVMDPTTQKTTPIWRQGTLVVDSTMYAQGTSPTVTVYGAAKDQAAVLLATQPCVIAAGSRLYRIFSTMVSSVDLRGYEAIGVACELSSAPATADRYTITVQLSFYPFEGPA